MMTSRDLQPTTNQTYLIKDNIMTEKKLSNNSSSSKFESVLEEEEAQAVFIELCQKLDISDQLVHLSIKDYTAVKSCFILQGDQKLWLVCALYGLVLSISNGGGNIQINTGNTTVSSSFNDNDVNPAYLNNFIMMEIPIHNRKPNTPNYTNSACYMYSNTINSGNNVVATIKPTNNNLDITSGYDAFPSMANSLNFINSSVPSQLSNQFDNSDSGSLLSKILSIIKIDTNLFFSKFNNWMRMIDLPKHVTQLMSSIEMSERTTNVIFERYVQIFAIFFRVPEEYGYLDLKCNKRKTRKRLCDLNELFHFCWFLFVATKELISVIYDISAGFHLLLHSIKFAFINIIRDNDLSLKLLSKTLLENEENLNQLKSLTVIELDNFFYNRLTAHNVEFVREEADIAFQRTFIPAMEFIKQQDQFFFNFSLYKSALEPEHLTKNLKYLMEFYRDYRILHFGIDEMEYVKLLYSKDIFVPVSKSSIISPNDNMNNQIFYRTLISNHATKNDTAMAFCIDNTNNSLITPPKKQLHVASSINHDDLPLSLSPTDYVSNLLSSLKCIIYNVDGSNYKNSLITLLESKSFNAAARKAETLPESALNIFRESVKDENETSTVESFKISLDLYYRILYFTSETEFSCIPHSNDSKPALSFLCSHYFHKSLLAICFDIFIFIWNFNKPFPWICEIFDIEPFYCVQCIEMVVKNESKLPRAIIKHLTLLEEDIISYYGWLPASPLYSRLEFYINCDNNGNERVYHSYEDLTSVLPFFCNVKIDGVFDYDDTLLNTTEPLFDRFDFVNVSNNDPNSLYNKFCNVEVFYALRKIPNKMTASSVSIFFQKVYYVLLTRLNDFGIKLQLSRGEKALVWKCMEYILVFHTYLMKNHHLDQILICSIYTMLKVINRPASFSKILQHYSTQPQAKLSTYSQVSASIISTLLHNNSLSINFTISLNDNDIRAFLGVTTQRMSPVKSTDNTTSNINFTSNEQSKTISDNNRMSPPVNNDNNQIKTSYVPFGASTTFIVSNDTRNRMLELFTPKQLSAMKDETCDIIQFYNKIFSHIIQRFANDVAQSFIQKRIIVEPYPTLKTDSLVSPLRISQNYSVFVSPMKLSINTNHYNPDQPSTPFINKVQHHNLTGNSNCMRFNLTSDRSPLVCKEINRFITETKKDYETFFNSIHRQPVKRRLMIDEDDNVSEHKKQLT